MVEDTHDGEFLAPPPTGSHIRPNAGPVGIGPFTYQLSEQSVQVREAANAAIKSVVERNGLARYMKPTYRNVSAAHPLGGCRMADSKDFGVVDHRNEVFGYEGLFCMDSSSIPTSLGVNPSLTISAVAERACEQLIARADGYGLPARPAGLQARRARRVDRPARRAAPGRLGRGDRREGAQPRGAPPDLTDRTHRSWGSPRKQQKPNCRSPTASIRSSGRSPRPAGGSCLR